VAVDPGAVGAAEIRRPPAGAVVVQLQVTARHQRVRQVDSAARVATDDHLLGWGEQVTLAVEVDAE
jgi:hypothetical protein